MSFFDEYAPVLIVLTLFVVIPLGVGYYFDKSSCTDKATNYSAQVTSYSWFKNYCFVKMPNGTTVNLENYRDVNEQ